LQEAAIAERAAEKERQRQAQLAIERAAEQEKERLREQEAERQRELAGRWRCSVCSNPNCRIAPEFIQEEL
jgi:hypothetical protein